MECEISNIHEYKEEIFKSITNNNYKDAVKLLKLEKFNYWEISDDNNFTGIEIS